MTVPSQVCLMRASLSLCEYGLCCKACETSRWSSSSDDKLSGWKKLVTTRSILNLKHMEFRHERWKSGLLHATSDFDPTNWEINFIGETPFQLKKNLYSAPQTFRAINWSRRNGTECYDVSQSLDWFVIFRPISWRPWTFVICRHKRSDIEIWRRDYKVFVFVFSQLDWK